MILGVIYVRILKVKVQQMTRFTRAEATAYGFLIVLAVFCLLPFVWVS